MKNRRFMKLAGLITESKSFEELSTAEGNKLLNAMKKRGELEAEKDFKAGKYIELDDNEYSNSDDIDDRLMDVFFEVCEELGIEPDDTWPEPWENLWDSYVNYGDK